MPEGSIPYAHLVETALMGVVRGVLEDTAKVGLDQPHHFYITFRTDHPGVEIPAELRQRYRQEMTIVLQHQFWDLAVTAERFQVTLSFGGRPQRLSIPFAAIKVFADPGVEFGLQFTLADAEADGETTTTDTPKLMLTPLTSETPAADSRPADASPVAETAPEPPAADAERPEGGADIVTLDRFRKR